MSASPMDPDTRYAKGEITRDEWLRSRGAASGSPSAPSPAAPLPRAPARRRAILVAAVIVVAGVLVAAALVASLGPSSVTPWNPSFGSAWRMPASDMAALNGSATMGTPSGTNNTLWFSGDSVDLVVYMSPPDHDMAFVVQGMANPSIHVAAGSRVKVTVVNMDPDEYHNWALSRSAPPYSSMPMMGSGAMMSMTMLSPASGSGYPSQWMSFTAQSGSYWYLCQYAGHAAAGMYGGFVVA